MPLGMELDLGPGDFVLDGDPGGGAPPQLWAHVHCGQTTGWIKIALVLYWDPAPLIKKAAEPPPQFSAHFHCGQTAGCIRMPLGLGAGHFRL